MFIWVLLETPIRLELYHVVEKIKTKSLDRHAALAMTTQKKHDTSSLSRHCE